MDHDDGADDSTTHPWDLINELQQEGTDEQQSALLRALALTAPSPALLGYVGTAWVEGLEYLMGAEEEQGKSVHLLLAAGLAPDTLLRVLSGIYPDLLESMGAAAILAGSLEPAQIEWLLSRTAPDRRDWL